MYRRGRDEESTCGCCGRVTYRSVHDHYPECSDGCSEWLVDRRQEERHGIWQDDER